jgi:pimeloyl-ACP methyl ester carboxylesterase
VGDRWLANLSRDVGERLPGVGPRWREAGLLLARLAEPVPARVTGAPDRRAGGPLAEVRLSTADGLSLAAWFLPSEGDQSGAGRLPVLVHHHFGATRHDYLPVARFLRAAGHPVLLLDARSHGDSDAGDPLGLSLGARPLDVKAGAAHLRERGFRRFAGYGFSMGAAVVLMGAAECPGLVGLVLDSGPVVHLYAACKGVIDARMTGDPPERRRAAARRLYLDGMGWRYRRDLEAAAARIPRIPALILHGERDEVLPPAETALLQRQVLQGPCERVVLPATEHVTGWARHRRRYRELVLDFLRGVGERSGRPGVVG